MQAVDDGTDLDGRATLFCGVHGERYAPVKRPANFVRYDQREKFERAIAALKVTTPVDPEASKRAQGRRGIKQISVVGRALADRIHAA